MHDIFKNIDDEKRDRIINSAFEEFSKNGFEKASTNIIVKNAGISKGSLFHYFESKKELYEKLEEFTMEIVTKAVAENIDWTETDFFERIKKIVITKGQVMVQYPYIYDFISVVMASKSVEEIREEAKKTSPNLEQKVYTHNIDFSKFKEDLDVPKAMNVIRWTFEKFGEEIWNKLKSTTEHIDFNKIEKEFDGYILFLKEMFYKVEK